MPVRTHGCNVTHHGTLCIYRQCTVYLQAVFTLYTTHSTFHLHMTRARAARYLSWQVPSARIYRRHQSAQNLTIRSSLLERTIRKARALVLPMDYWTDGARAQRLFLRSSSFVMGQQTPPCTHGRDGRLKSRSTCYDGDGCIRRLPLRAMWWLYWFERPDRLWWHDLASPTRVRPAANCSADLSTRVFLSGSKSHFIHGCSLTIRKRP